jgi:hypothetical protein
MSRGSRFAVPILARQQVAHSGNLIFNRRQSFASGSAFGRRGVGRICSGLISERRPMLLFVTLTEFIALEGGVASARQSP